MIVNPAPGALVRDPVTKLAIEDGAEIDANDPYWARALADGDIATPDEKTPAVQPAPSAEPARTPSDKASN